MVETPFGVTLGLISSIIVSGGIAAAVFEFIRDLFLKRREEYVEISKTRIDTLTKASPYYIDLQNASGEISILLREEPINNMLLFYKICYYFHSLDKFNIDIGGHYFENKHADFILDHFASFLGGQIYLSTNIEFVDRLYRLVNDETSYDQFCRNLLNCPFLYVQFEAFLRRLTSEEINDIENRMRWFADIIGIETDFSYQLWYRDKPYVDDVSEDLLVFLKLKYPKYYKRIDSLRRTRLYRKRNIRADETPNLQSETSNLQTS